MSSVGADATLGDLGLDSLMGVEVKQTLERDYEIVMSMKDIRQLTINKLREIAGGATPAGDKAQGSGSKKASLNSSSARYNLTEMMPTADLVKMNEVEGSQPLFVVHPIEGKNSRYFTIFFCHMSEHFVLASQLLVMFLF